MSQEAMPTTQSPTIGKLALALSKAQGEMRPAVKDAANPFFKTKYADLSSVWDSARDLLAKHELAVVQSTESDADAVYLVTLLAHSSGEWVRGKLRVKPVKDDPQSWGSAITYARRYAFSAMVGVTTDDDDGHQGTHGGSSQQQRQPAQPPKPPMGEDEAKAVTQTVKAAIERSADPASTWKAMRRDIDAVKAFSEAMYDELIKAAAQRKAVLSATPAATQKASA